MSRSAPALRQLVNVSNNNTVSAIHSTHRRVFNSSARSCNVISRAKPCLLPEFSLRDKVVVVSGGAQGLGLVLAEALLEAGATVHAIDRLPSPANDLSSTFSSISKRAKDELGTFLTYHQADVRDVSVLNQIMENITNQSSRLDGLIAAAGINQETQALEHTADVANRILGINVTGVFMTAQAAARQMVRLKKPGSICLVASMSGTIANKGMYAPAYNASKAAVIQLCRSLAAEWGQHGIRVNSLSPGYIMTEMLQNLFDGFPERKTLWPTENMLSRLSMPHEYRGAAVFLLSDASSFMTGSDLRIDGGHAAW
ncbi:NAD(P)-binding domain protein [Metarhizium album ARSEF 1941]|uniref:Hydroxynaphthalene reductase-like protein Arp2 n=1 Tax=Metarhizium album (strain ARSEF 1941) TaxID=1081103 RepID=A0A0B2WUE4_METAS|nr:NAD(P)-binding domain protein [Metarhizium album ARSEF 1941]KHN97688.1 NAD(P)-binding domain protein [Metarhizium album ARSEF 1941]